MSTSPDKTLAEQSVQKVQLGDQKAEDDTLAERLRELSDKIDNDFAGNYKAQEWLAIIVQSGIWVCKKGWKGLTVVFKRLSNDNERRARADKTRKEGKAIVIKAEAEADLIHAQAQTERAKAREQEIKNETAEDLLQKLRERGIDIAAQMKDGQLHVAVVKDETLAIPPVEGLPLKKVRKRRGGMKKRQDGDQTSDENKPL